MGGWGEQRHSQQGVVRRSPTARTMTEVRDSGGREVINDLPGVGVLILAIGGHIVQSDQRAILRVGPKSGGDSTGGGGPGGERGCYDRRLCSPPLRAHWPHCRC